MDGLISFFGAYHALRAETVLRREGFAVQLIPGPKELSPNCGMAMRFEFDKRDSVVAFLDASNVHIEAVHCYRPRTDDWMARHPRTFADRLRQWL